VTAAPPATSPRRTRRLLRLLVVCAAAAPAAFAGSLWLASWRISRLLHDWAPAVVTEQSGGVYRLEVARVRPHLLERRIVVDSIRFTTDSAANARRSHRLADVRITLLDCSVGNLAIVRLWLNQGFHADSFGCRKGSVAVDARRRTDTTLGLDAGHAFLALQRGITLPRYAPRVGVARIEFPDLAFDWRLPRAGGRATRLVLSRLHWRMGGFAIDAADTAAPARPLFSRHIDFAAFDFVAHVERGTAVRVGRMRASITDSTVELGDVRFARGGRTVSGGRAYRRDSIATWVNHIAVQGIDVGQFALGEGVRARRVAIDSFRVDVTSDRRLPPNPKRTPRRTPQQWIAGIEQSLRADSVLIAGGAVSYREHREGRPRPGVLTFAGIEAVATNLHHVVGRRRGGDTMTVLASAELQRAGRLEARFRVPLDAPQFTLDFDGRLNPMPGEALNAFVEHVLPLRITRGRITGITYAAKVRAGRARGRITPLYDDLAVAVTHRGADGLLGNRGIVGDAARSLASLAVNWRVRDRNPDGAGQAPRVGVIDHAFADSHTLPGYLWFTLRDGLFAVIRK
jgi:hypothetical protein